MFRAGTAPLKIIKQPYPVPQCMDYMVVDGSQGEGGGQIVRTAMAISCITGQPIVVQHIRQGRRVPGLKPQHLAVIHILQRMCGGTVRGARIGSDTLEFCPGIMRDSAIYTDVGTAGNIPLILQAVVPAAWASGVRLDLDITGGTDTRWAPTADYASRVMGAAYRSMGADLHMEVERRGYYPRGGGRIRTRIGHGCLLPADLTAEPTGEISIRCTKHGVDAAGPAAAIAEVVTQAGHSCTLDILDQKAVDHGAAILAYRTGTGFAAGTDSLYADGFSPIAYRLLECTSVDENLADMLVVPASVADGTSVFVVRRTTKHLETALYVASLITGCEYDMASTDGGVLVSIRGAAI